MTKPKRPVRVLILTSIRDVGACDMNGTSVPTRDGPQYMKGVVEHIVHECCPTGALCGCYELAGVVTDDTEKDLAKSAYPLTPVEGRRWIHPQYLEDHHKVMIRDVTLHVPSSFRALPRDDIKGRCAAKEAFEAQVFRIMQELGADIIVSDHYMAKIEYLIGKFGLYGRMLNIHPAVTVSGHPFCFRGPTPTADAIAHAKCNGVVKTGATLHLVNEKFDDGPVIHWDAPTPVYPIDEPPELRARNYRMAKLPVFTRGMQKYLHEVFEHA